MAKKQEKMIEKIIAKKCTPVDLEAMTHVHDDYDKVVGMTDFIVYKLKETGKINEDDISAAMKGYEDHVYKQEKKIQD